ncbi:MAG: nuclear transport factor 2 family protein [candidate division NC10 bacterium]|nr:nuclear transport factor 2 family protein [candidate division NC10 bacterium]
MNRKWKDIAIIGLFPVLLLFCALPTLPVVASAGEEETVRVIREFFEKFSRRDQEGMIDQLLELFTPDALYVIPTGTYQGKEKIRERLATLVETRRDSRYTMTKILVQGSDAATEYVSEFTDRKTGKYVRYSGVGLWQIEGGKIRSVKWYLDTNTIQKQLQ